MFVSLLVICLLVITATDASPYAPHKLVKREIVSMISECCNSDGSECVSPPPMGKDCPNEYPHSIAKLVDSAQQS
ncbi:hypothetical protein KIN20_030748 [Parelaphostrongylus tenuis]|uniref:Uncharacterized protein n=1 Tax=Parelaphostrongylus tenuis TaxID=148309 RepID=A0AAD5WGP8_PARTN|nr:hypothetical protein KIN20_030748 [Parelaphostrongylus tenuis]